MVNGKQYGELISPQDEPNVLVNLPDGEHECYLAVIPKDKDQEVYESNILVRNQYSLLFSSLTNFLNRKSTFLLPMAMNRIKIGPERHLKLPPMYTTNFSLLKSDLPFILEDSCSKTKRADSKCIFDSCQLEFGSPNANRNIINGV